MAYRFQISANLLSWPSYCACCDGDADNNLRAAASKRKGRRVQRTTTSSWEVPYCSTCVRHKNGWDLATVWLAVGVVLGVIVWILVAQRAGGGVGLIVGVGLGSLSLFPYQRTREQARNLMLPSCSTPSSAVSYIEWHGSFHTFIFSSKPYLDRFLAQNSEKKRSEIAIVPCSPLPENTLGGSLSPHVSTLPMQRQREASLLDLEQPPARGPTNASVVARDDDPKNETVEEQTAQMRSHVSAIQVPSTFEEYVGQSSLKEQMRVSIDAAKVRRESLCHVLLCGPEGIGKRTLANVIANEMQASIRAVSGSTMERPGDLAAVLTNLDVGDFLFVDEVHRLNAGIGQLLGIAMERFQIDVLIGLDAAARSVTLDLKRFTVIAATTGRMLVPPRLRDQFELAFQLEFYTPEDLVPLVCQSALTLNIPIDGGGALEIARRSRGTPSVARALVRRVRDFAQIRNHTISAAVAHEALATLGIDSYGCDQTDRAILRAIIEDFNGGPVGLGAIAAAVAVEPDAIEAIHEPFLIHLGLLARTPKGRISTQVALEKLASLTEK